MEYRKLGGSGVNVSTLCLGSMTFGLADENSFMHDVCCDEHTAHAIMNRALDSGINFIDTADVYGQDGLSERVIGNWFARERRREEVVLATKFRFMMGEGPNKTGASRYRIVRRVEESLKRLQTDRIDLYQIHMQDVGTPEDEILGALDDLVRQGKVVYIGASNYAAYRLMESLWVSDTHLFNRFVTLQAHYNLLTRDLEREHIPLCERFDIGLLPWSPLAGGFLTGKYKRDAEAPRSSRFAKRSTLLERYDNDRGWRVVDTLRSVADELSATPAQVALAWCIAKPAVSSVVFGARSIEQLEQNCAAADIRLTSENMHRLDEVSAFNLGYPYDFMKQIQGRW